MTEDRAVDPVPLGMSKHDLGREEEGSGHGGAEFQLWCLLVFPARSVTALLAQSPCPSSHL